MIAEIQAAALANGGRLVRSEGGYWWVPGKTELFNDTMVRRMVQIGLARYLKVKRWRGRVKLIEVEIFTTRGEGRCLAQSHKLRLPGSTPGPAPTATMEGRDVET